MLGLVLSTRVDLASVLFVLSALLNGFLLRYQVVEDAVYPKAFLSDLAVFSVFAAISFALRRNWRPYFYIGFSIFFCMILIFDVTYFRSHSSVLSIFLLPQIQFLPQVSEAAISQVKAIDALFVLNTAVFTGVVVALRRRGYFDSRFESGRSRRRKLTTFFILALLIFGTFAAFLTKVEASRITKQWNRPYLVEHFGVYTFHMSDLIKYLSASRGITDIDRDSYKSVLSYFEERERARPPRNAYTGILDGQSVIVLHAESVQSMFLFRKFKGQEITPNLNELASRGLFFDNFYAQQSSGTSSDSEFTLNTSLYPINNGTVFISHFKNTFVSIPKKLKEKGYTVVAAHGNDGDFWNRELMYSNLGYDEFYSKGDFDIDEVIGMGLSDRSFFRQAMEKIDALPRPFYAKLIMLSNHTPFSDVGAYGEFDSGEFEGTRFGNYLKSLHYADRAIGDLMADLERRGLDDDTAIVIYGDHPANLPRGATATFLGLDKLDSYDHRRFKTVPFMIVSSKIDEAKVVSEPMGMIDVMPTLGNMMGFDNPFAIGYDIFSVSDNAVGFPDGSWIDRDVLFISSTMKFKVFGDEMIRRFKVARCDRASREMMLGVTGPAADAVRCRKISKKRIFRFREDRSIISRVKSLGLFAYNRIARRTEEISRGLDVSSVILDHDLLHGQDRHHRYSIAQLGR